ncbi:MAG: UDP-N-acetylmuramoyl-L-alanine--D-glutamate ligase [Mariprofundaceae bacterium]|nr:UDP-N-acetylmuramoyl-L-alanine--D-glutamate ligase [Mariprofundaceae bacterium]
MTNTRAQKHAIIGMGKTGISIAHFLLRQGFSCEAFDENLKKPPEDLPIPFHRGALNSKELQAFDRIWVSPGIRWSLPALQKTRHAGIHMQGDLSLFLEYCHTPLIAITGTNGKTTATQIIQTLLETLPGGCDMGGNIGTPVLDLIRQDKPIRHIVLELSSFQLERCDAIHPRWAVMLNIQADHADMHDSDAAYLAAKLRLFTHQGMGDTAMLPMDGKWNDLSQSLTTRGVQVHRFGQISEQDPAAETLVAGILNSKKRHILFWHQDGQRQNIHCQDIPTRGLHQHINLAVAAQAAADFGVSSYVIREAITSFRGLKHRLRLLGNVAKHDWFDDSKATNPAAAKAALASFDQSIWICGGLRKGLDLTVLSNTIRAHVAHAIVIGKDKKAYIQLLQSSGIRYTVANSMERAVLIAAAHASQLPVLLSPAAASQDQFANYAERGQAFAKAINALEKQVLKKQAVEKQA